MKMTLTRRVTFAAGHRLYNPAWSDEKNHEVFGLCANPHGHGHNYVLEVSVTGEIDPETGMVMNLKQVKAIIEREVVSKIDHQNLNQDVAFMQDIIPTTENLAQQIWKILDLAFPGEALCRLVLWESENNKVEISR